MNQVPNPTTPSPTAAGAASGPMRTCVGCRTIDAQAKLLRLVADEAGRLHCDTNHHRSSGRGCYVHRTTACVQAALRGGFQRSLRRSLRLSDSEIKAALASSETLMQPEPPARAARGHSNRDNS